MGIFWLDIEGVLLLFHAFIVFLSCEIIPLQLYPNMLQVVIKILPFKYVFYQPLCTLAFGISKAEIYEGFKVGMIWVVVLTCISSVIWKRVNSRMCIQGG